MINVYKTWILFVVISNICISVCGQKTGVTFINPEKCDEGFRLVTIGDLSTAHLVDTSGRCIYSWSNPAKGLWKSARINSAGQLQVDLSNGEIGWLSVSGKWEDRAAAELDPIEKEKVNEVILENGHRLSNQRERHTLRELTTEGEVVWEYINQDSDVEGNLYPISGFVVYPEQDVATLFTQFPPPPPFTRTELRQQRRNPATDIQYKRLNRETIAEIEAGYLDDAHNFLQTYFELYPEDEEGYFAMSVLQTKRGNIEKALEYTRMALEAGLPLGRFTSGLGDLLTPLLASDEFKKIAYQAAQDLLVHGPMLGQLTNEGMAVWVRTENPAEIVVNVYDMNDPDSVVASSQASTSPELEHTVVIQVSGLQSSTTYFYQLSVDGIPYEKTYEFNTSAQKGAPSVFRMGFSGGAGYTPWFERMWDTLHTHDMSLFLLLGDNVYIDHPERPVTQKYCYYRRQSRPEFRRFTAETAIYAIWDDHDFTYNDERGGPAIDEPYWKREVLDVFKHQWLNPYYGGGESHPGCYFDFSMGDVDFIMLDCRYYRDDPEKEGASMLGEVQKRWLKDKLLASKGTFKVIASSVPWAMNTKPGSLDTWDGHPEEREEIFSFIEEHQIEGVVLISADRHRSDAWRIERPNGYDFFDLMSSKLTNVHTHRIMPGSLFGYNQTCSFGMLEFDTTRDNPQVQYRIFNIDNEEIHRMTIYRDQLTYD